MISSTARRVVLVCSQIPIVSSFSTCCPRAVSVTAPRLTSYRTHQRRLSSSKPSSPADGSKGVAENAVVAASPSQSRADGEKKASRGGRRKAKDLNVGTGLKGDRDEAFKNLPSVPSTQHIAPFHICASGFFSLHRPISLTKNFPKPVTDEAFAAIFSPRTKTNAKPADVISTLSSTVEMLDPTLGKTQPASQQDQWNDQADDLRAAISAQANPIIDFPHHILSGMYLPFNPPPTPKPTAIEQENQDDTTLSTSTSSSTDMDSNTPQPRTYTALLTIEEYKDANGATAFKTRSSEMYESSGAVRFYIKALRERQRRGRMWAISVKRQRKLKMKKHKYKKLMRRTRTLRRKLERG